MNTLLSTHQPGDPVTLPQNVRNFLRISDLHNRNLTCAICNQPIQSRYFLDPYGTTACNRHELDYCCLCGRIITGPRVQVPGYGYSCTDCGMAIKYDELETIRLKINEFYTRLRIFIPGYRLSLRHAQDMAQAYSQYFDRPPLGAAWKDDGSPEHRYRIDIMSQQSKVGLGNTLAHELLHLWQYHRGINAPKEYAEGFCNLGAFLYTASVDKGEALVYLSRMMENRDKHYGVAFRQLKVLYDVYGLPAVIAAMKSFTER